MDRVLDSPFISLQPASFTPHSNLVMHMRKPEEEAAASDSNSASRVRRFHHKSRTGCLECKRKRRKCDEGKPSCGGCVRSKCECIFEENIPPRAQPKNRKRPQRKQGANRFVFIEFSNNPSETSLDIINGPESGSNQGERAVSPTDSSTNSSHSGISEGPISHWQSAPTTCLLQGGHTHVTDRALLSSEVEYLDLFRNFTRKTLPMQYYNRDSWATVTFELAYSQPYLYNIIIAVSASHHRYLRSQSYRSAQEISCYVRALSNFRTAMSNRAIVATMTGSSWVIVLVTAALLSMYVMSCPVDNFEISFDTYFSLARGTINMLAEARTKSVKLPLPNPGWFARKKFGTSELETQPRYPGLEFASQGEDRAISEISRMRLEPILTALTGTTEMDTISLLTLLKSSLEWVTSTDQVLIKEFREKNPKAYCVVAHYYAALWKLKSRMQGLSVSGKWQDESGSVDCFWWLISAGVMCKQATGWLESRAQDPIYLAWVSSIIRELEAR